MLLYCRVFPCVVLCCVVLCCRVLLFWCDGKLCCVVCPSVGVLSRSVHCMILDSVGSDFVGLDCLVV